MWRLQWSLAYPPPLDVQTPSFLQKGAQEWTKIRQMDILIKTILHSFMPNLVSGKFHSFEWYFLKFLKLNIFHQLQQVSQCNAEPACVSVQQLVYEWVLLKVIQALVWTIQMLNGKRHPQFRRVNMGKIANAVTMSLFLGKVTLLTLTFFFIIFFFLLFICRDILHQPGGGRGVSLSNLPHVSKSNFKK